MAHGIDLSQFDLEGIDIASLNLDKLDSKLTIPINSSATTESQANSTKYGVADMTNIARLNEKSVANNMMLRFQNDKIYTYIGSVLVSVNPFKFLPGLFDSPKAYRGKTLMEQPPHIFALTEKGYSSMMSQQLNQTFLISGESGAGKTEAMKKILEYLSAICPTPEDISEPVHEKVLYANPILENFGNAKTVHNKNSSRFGKFTEIQFDSLGGMIGAKICDYLLEKTRIVHQSANERNYHIFYRLLIGATEEEKKKLYLTGMSAMDFSYTNMGKCPNVQGLDDEQEYLELKDSLQLFLSPVFIDNLWRIVAAVLHIGNVEFEGTAEKVKGIVKDKPLECASSLLGVKMEAFRDLLVHRYTVVGSESYKNPRKMKGAVDTRNTFCKTVYSRLFKWVVARLNDALCNDEPTYFLGLLDIFGFEVFKYNDLEQFCINFANEALQDLFNEYIFKIEQEQYKEEELKVKPVQFVDNQMCLELMSAPRSGIFDLLDDQSKLSTGSIDHFMHGIEQTHKKHPNFAKDRKRRHAICIKHYAGKVTYETVNWIEKNTESTPQEMNEMIKTSENALLQAIFAENSTGGGAPQRKPSKLGGARPGRGGGRNVLTITAQFKKSLNELLDTLKKTNPFFIRCLKPNAEQVPDRFDQNYIVNQMRSVGMLDTITIRKTGFPVRYEYAEFLDRYKIILPEDKRKELWGKNLNNQDMTEQILKELQVTEDEYAFGKSKLFMKDMPSDRLENRYSAIQNFRLRKIKQAIRAQRREQNEDAAKIGEEHKKEDAKLGLTDATIVDPETAPGGKAGEAAKQSPIVKPKSMGGAELAVPGGASPKAKPGERSRIKTGASRQTLRRKTTKSSNEPSAAAQVVPTVPSPISEPPTAAPMGTTPQYSGYFNPTTTDASAHVEIAKLFLTDDGETKKVTFTGVRSEQEFQRLFKHTYANHTFPTPFPKLYMKDIVSQVSYEITDYGEVGEGTEVKTNRISVDVSHKLDEMNTKLERGFDVVKDHMRLLSTTGATPSLPTAGSAENLLKKTTSKKNVAGKSISGVNLEDLQDQRRQLQQLRRDVAICKQIARDEHENFIKDLEVNFHKILEHVTASMTPLQIKRAQLQKNKTLLATKCAAVVEGMTELEELVNDTHSDMLKRKIKPADAVHESINNKFLNLETDYSSVNAIYDSAIDGFEKLWELEKNITKEEQDELTVDTNNTLCDMEEMHENIVMKLEEIQHFKAHREVDIPIMDFEEVDDLEEAVDSIMDQISMTKVNNESRLKAMQKMEEKMKKRKEMERQADPLVQFANDLNSNRFKLKKTGGFEELERMRKQKDKEVGMVGSVLED